MGTFIVRRLLISIPVFIGITLLVFVFVALAPGDAASAMIRPEQAANPIVRQQVIEKYGLDQPIPIRYVRWLGSVVQGELGYRLINGRPIASEIGRSFGASLLLMGTALVFGILDRRPVRRALGHPAVLEDRLLPDRHHLPGHLDAVVPAGHRRPVAAWPAAGSRARSAACSRPASRSRLLGPAAPSLPCRRRSWRSGSPQSSCATPARRCSRCIDADYVKTAQAKGLSGRTVISRHAFRNAIIPVITIIALFIPEMIGGAVVTEQVFSWPGLGQLAVDAVTSRDYSADHGHRDVLAIFVLLANLIDRRALRVRRSADQVVLRWPFARSRTGRSPPTTLAARTESPTRAGRSAGSCVTDGPARDGRHRDARRAGASSATSRRPYSRTSSPATSTSRRRAQFPLGTDAHRARCARAHARGRPGLARRGPHLGVPRDGDRDVRRRPRRLLRRRGRTGA